MNARRAAALLAAVLGLAVLYAGVRWGAMVAGGADSYGYVSQAGLWQRGGLTVQEDVIRPSPWPLAANTWAPLGYRPAPHRPDAIVPVYAPGLPLAGGLAASAAIAIRPNLVPLALVLLVWMVITRRVMRHDLWFALGLVPAIAGIAWLNASLYENAWTSGYGTTGYYYALSFLSTNARQFAAWMAEVETPIVALAGLYFVAPRLFPAPRIPFARSLLGGTLAVVALSYLFYRPFDAWWYLRFLLPMWPVLMLLTAAALEAMARVMGRWMRPAYPVAIAAVAGLLACHGIFVAAERSVFDLGRGERRYIDVARFIADHTDPDAVILSVQHSGSLRIYAGRLTLRYDVLDPGWLDRTVDYLRSVGRRPYFVLDGQEVDAFRQRFGGRNRLGALDWPPLATLGSIVAVYDPIDRRLETSPLAIASTRGPRGGWPCETPQSWPPVLRMK